MPSSVRPFVIVSMARSGTQFLSELLNQHPDITTRGEILKPPHLKTDTVLVGGFYGHPTPVVGATLLHEQLVPHPNMLPLLLAIPDMRMIVLQRSDQLARLRSVKQAAQRRQWKVNRTPKKPLPAVTLDPSETLTQLQWAAQFYDDLHAIDYIPTLWLTYENLCADQDNVLADVWKFLDVQPPGPLTAHTYLQEPRSLAETITNLDELIKVLR